LNLCVYACLPVYANTNYRTVKQCNNLCMARGSVMPRPTYIIIQNRGWRKAEQIPIDIQLYKCFLVSSLHA